MSNATVHSEVSDSGSGVRAMFKFLPHHLLGELKQKLITLSVSSSVNW